jgi:hypothetical protein
MDASATDRDEDLQREEIRLPDGRRLVYYRFPETPDEEPAPGPERKTDRPGDAPGARH